MRVAMTMMLLAACAPPQPPERVPPDLSACVSMTADTGPDPIVVEHLREVPELGLGITLHNDCPTAVLVHELDIRSGNGVPFPSHPFPGPLAAGTSHRFEFPGPPTRVGEHLLQVTAVVTDLSELAEPLTVRAGTPLDIRGPRLEIVVRDPTTRETPIACDSEPARLLLRNTGQAAALIQGVEVRTLHHQIPGLDSFRLLSPPPDAFPLHVQPDDALDIEVTYRPHDAGEVPGMIELQSPYSFDQYSFHTDFHLLGVGAPRPSVTVFVDPGPDLDTDALVIPLSTSVDPKSIEVRQGASLRTDWRYEPDPPAVRLRSFVDLPGELQLTWRPTGCAT